MPPDLASAAEGVSDSASQPPLPIAECVVSSALGRNLTSCGDPWGGGDPPFLLEWSRCCQDIPQGE